MLSILLIILSIKAEVILLSEGDHYTKILSQLNQEIVDLCNEKIVLELTNIQSMTQTLQFKDVVELIYDPSESSVIWVLTQQGQLSILQAEDEKILSKYIIRSQYNLGEMPGFQCSDIVQTTVKIFLAVCWDANKEVNIAKISCEYTDFNCTIEMHQLQNVALDCEEYSIISETTWRNKDPEYFSLYCYHSLKFQQQIVLLKNKPTNNGMVARVLDVPLTMIQKISFFDEQTLMILDHYQGLLVIKFVYYEEEEMFDYSVLLQQLFLPNEQYFAMAYSLEQAAIRFPPTGVMENDIKFTIVLISDLNLYEIVLPESSSQLFNLKLPLNDKINLKTRSKMLRDGKQLSQAEIQYDEQYYYLCLYTISLESECLRISRHSSQQSSYKTLLTNQLSSPLLLAYPVTYSPIVGQSNIIILQEDINNAKLIIIRNDVERFTVTSHMKGMDECYILYKKENMLISNYTIINEVFNSVDILKINNNQQYNFPSTLQQIPISSLLRGPDPIVIAKSKQQSKYIIYIQIDIQVSPYSGILFSMIPQISGEYVSKSKLNPISFFDDNFRLTFTQTQKINVIIQQQLVQSNNYTIEVYQVSCSLSDTVYQIVGLSPYYFIFYKNKQNVTRIKVNKQSDMDVHFNIECEDFQLNFLENNYDVEIDLGYNNIFISTPNIIYYTDFQFTKIYKIITNRKYRQINVQFIKNNLLLGSYENILYLVKLLNPYQNTIINTIEYQIDLQLEISSKFKYFIVKIKKPVPFLFIVDNDITVYTINNLEFDVSYDSKIPTFQAQILPENVQINYHTLFVPLIDKTTFYMYDLTLTGSDRLIAIHKDWGQMTPLKVSYPINNEYLYCIQNKVADILCYFQKVLEFELLSADPTASDNNFEVEIIAKSSLDTNVENDKILSVFGSFTYQDSFITKSNPQYVYETYKTNMVSTINIEQYFSGPVFFYQLQGSLNQYVTINSYIQATDSNEVIINLVQDVLGASATKEYLIILGTQSIDIMNIPVTQFNKKPELVQIPYYDINSIFFENDQPMIMYCTKSFIQPLRIAQLTSIHIIAFVCQIVMEGVFKSNEINELSFTIISDSDELQPQILNNMFFLNVLNQDYIYQKRSALLLDALEMINYPINYKPYKFITVMALVKQNKKYQIENNLKFKDQIICIIVGVYDQANTNFLEGQLVDQIGAQNMDQDTLIVNNFQMECISGCELLQDNHRIDSVIEIIFNDQYYFNIYRIRFHIQYEPQTQLIYKIISKNTINLKQIPQSTIQLQIVNQIYNSNYIDTKITRNHDQYAVNVTTDSISFDLVLNNNQIQGVEQIFKSYIQCKSQSGSLTASYNEFFAMSCRNESEYENERVEFVELFIRNSIQTHPNISVIQAIQIQGELTLIDIEKSQNNQFIQLLILEMVNNSSFQLRWFNLQNQFSVEAKSDAPQEIIKLELCAQNLKLECNDDECWRMNYCNELRLSNVGYGEYIFRETLLFMLLILLPLVLSSVCIIYGITHYKKEKQKRIEDFEIKLEAQLKVQTAESQKFSQNLEY